VVTKHRHGGLAAPSERALDTAQPHASNDIARQTEGYQLGRIQQPSLCTEYVGQMSKAPHNTSCTESKASKRGGRDTGRDGETERACV
jgi:hypothetical protein